MVHTGTVDLNTNLYIKVDILQVIASALTCTYLRIHTRTHAHTHAHTHTYIAVSLMHIFTPMQAIALVLAASLHRRHPMIWNVFAPRFLYEGAFFAVTELILFFVYIIAT